MNHLPLLVLRFIDNIDVEGVDGVEFPEQLSRSSDDGEGIADIAMEDNEEFILVLVRIMDPVMDLVIKGPMPPLRLSSKTLFGRTNFPRFGPQVKYRTPFTEPSFFPKIEGVGGSLRNVMNRKKGKLEF